MPEPKKTILFMVQLPPPVHGAALRNQSLLESEVIRSKFTVHSLPLQFVDELKNIGRFSFKKIGIALGYCFSLIKLLIGKKIDLAYFTMSPSGGAFYRDIIFITLLKLFRKKILLHFRVKGIRKTAGSRMGRALVRYAFRGSDIVCLSKNHLSDLAGLADRTPYIVPNGIKVENLLPPAPGWTSVYSGKKTSILFLSNLMKTKGLYELIDALHLLKKRGRDFEAAITGKELDISYAALKKLIDDKQLTDCVTITGPKYGNEKFLVLDGADIFVFPTYFELFPGVVLEAMQFGKPVVTTFEGSLPEIIDNGINGMLVPVNNAEALANAIEPLLLSETERRRLGRNAKEKFFSHFTLEKFEENMQSVFTDVLSK